MSETTEIIKEARKAGMQTACFMFACLCIVAGLFAFYIYKSYETTTKVLEAKGYNFKPCDWYYVLNMMYSDYYKPGRADDVYVEMACDFLNDVDGPKHKAKKWATMQ